MNIKKFLYQMQLKPLFVLSKHFLIRLFNNDILKFEDQRRENLIIMISILIFSGGIISAFILKPYLIAMLGYTSETIWLEKCLFITLSMAMTGIVSILNWDNMFLDEKDYFNLSHLPVRVNTLYWSKFLSIVVYVGIISLAFHLPAVWVFGFFQDSMYQVDPINPSSFFRFGVIHLIANFMANLFVFLLVAFIQSILFLVLTDKRIKKISMFVQSLLMMGFLSIFIWFPKLYKFLMGLKDNYDSIIYYIPPMWFVGFYEYAIGNVDIVFERLFYIAPIALVILMDLYILSIPLIYKKFSISYNKATVKKTTLGVFCSLKRQFNRLFLANPIEAAMFYFSLNTLKSSRKHKLQLAIFLTLPLSFIVTELVILVYKEGWESLNQIHPIIISMPLLFYFFLVLGYRIISLYPISEGANWIFQITDRKVPQYYIGGVKKLIFYLGLLPSFIGFFLIYIYFWDFPSTLFHSVFSVSLAWLLVEVFFTIYNKIPFVSANVPGKAKLKYFWFLYIGGFAIFIFGFTALGDFLLRNPLYYMIYYVLLSDLIFVLKKIQKWQNKSLVLVYDEEPEPAMLSLGFDP